MSPEALNRLNSELNNLKKTFDLVLAKQIDSKNIANKSNRVDMILPPTSEDLDAYFDTLSHKYVSDFKKDHPYITPAEIIRKIDPWPIFVEYALRIYYLQPRRGFDEKLFLRLLLLVIFTLVQGYDSGYPFPNKSTLDNYIANWKEDGRMNPQNLKKDVRYLTDQIAANMP